MSILSDPDPSETRDWSTRCAQSCITRNRAAAEVFEGVCTDLPPAKKK